MRRSVEYQVDLALVPLSPVGVWREWIAGLVQFPDLTSEMGWSMLRKELLSGTIRIEIDRHALSPVLLELASVLTDSVPEPLIGTVGIPIHCPSELSRSLCHGASS